MRQYKHYSMAGKLQLLSQHHIHPDNILTLMIQGDDRYSEGYLLVYG